MRHSGTAFVQAVAATFLVVDESSLRRVDLGGGGSGATVRATALGLVDSGTAVELVVTGEAMRPASSVHLNAAVDGDGTFHCSWVRRSRRGWAWLDLVDVPLEFATELYRVTVSGPNASLNLETGEPNVQWTAQQLSPLGGGVVRIAVVQVGDLAVSRPQSLSITIDQD